MTSKLLVFVFCLLLTPFGAHSQQTTVQNPQALALAIRALAALNGTTQVSDVTLTGSATRSSGSNIESGNITLKALGMSKSRWDLSLADGALSEIFNQSSGIPQGFWIGSDGTIHPLAGQNCVAGEVWFFPGLSVLTQVANPNVGLAYIGPETIQGAAVQHIQFVYQIAASPGSNNKLISQLSATDVYLDTSSYLPVALAFNAHPDNDAGANIRVEINLSNYQVVNGVQIPFRIQKFISGTLFLDVTVQTAQLNTGLTDSVFSVN